MKWRIGIFFAGVLLFSGCFSAEKTPVTALQSLEKRVLERHLAGNSAADLSRLARTTRQATSWSKLPDLAAFARQDSGDRKDLLSREILWESAAFCVVQFSPDPAAFIRQWNAGKLRCQLMQLLSEKQFLDSVAWKTPSQQSRELEIHSELQQLTGDLPEEELSRIKLATPEILPKTPLPVPVPMSEDPAEALQIAGAIYLLPDEIRRQKLADPEFATDGIMLEVLANAGSYAVYAGEKHLALNLESYRKEPSAERLWHWRKWYYFLELDRSRLPEKRGGSKDQHFIQSMLLLQSGF